MRHGFLTKYDPGPGVSISTLAYEYAPGFLVPEHSHGAAQVIYAIRGVMQVSAGESYWMIPPHAAVWIPACTSHRIRVPHAVSMRTLYLRPGLAPRLPDLCKVLHVTPLLRELIVETVRIGNLRSRNPLHCALRDLLLAQLQSAPALPMFLTMPRDPRALVVAQALRGQGIGAHLLAAFESWAAQRGVARLSARAPAASPAEALFRGRGWVEEARLARWLAGQEFVQLRRDLAPPTLEDPGADQAPATTADPRP